MKHHLFSLSALALLGTAPSAGAISCVVVSNQPATIKVAGTHQRLPAMLDPCSAATVTEGTATFGYTTAAGQRVFKTLKQGASFQPPKNANDNGGASAFGATVLAFFSGDQKVGLGLARGGEAKPGWPTGRMLLATNDREFRLPPNAAESFAIKDDAGRTLDIAYAAASGQVRIADLGWLRGRWYAWEATRHGKVGRGEFYLADAADVAAWSHTAAAPGGNEGADFGTRLEQAERLHELGFEYDAFWLLASDPAGEKPR